VLSAAGHGPKLRVEFAALAAIHPTHGWDATEKRLLDAGVFEDRHRLRLRRIDRATFGRAVFCVRCYRRGSQRGRGRL